jgi:hypothetical protein
MQKQGSAESAREKGKRGPETDSARHNRIVMPGGIPVCQSVEKRLFE